MGANSSQDYIDSANRRYALTSNTSGKILDSFNSQGGNTPIKNYKTTPTVTEPSIFDKVIGIFDKIGTMASARPAQSPYVVKSAPVPYLAFAGVALVGLFLYKAVK